MDGVIYHGNQILPGVPEFIQWLHDEKKEYLFLTNICAKGIYRQRRASILATNAYALLTSDYFSFSMIKIRKL